MSSTAHRRRVPPIGPWLLLGCFAAFWWLTGSLLAAVAIFAACFVGALLYNGAMGHSR